MATKKKGMLTVFRERSKSLKKDLRRAFWKGERAFFKRHRDAMRLRGYKI